MTVSTDEFEKAVITTLTRPIDDILKTAAMLGKERSWDQPVYWLGDTFNLACVIGSARHGVVDVPAIKITAPVNTISYEFFESLVKTYEDFDWEVRVESNEGDGPFTLVFILPEQLAGFYQ